MGDLDPLREESILMAQRWQLTGSRVDLDVWPEGDHAFTNMATPSDSWRSNGPNPAVKDHAAGSAG